MNNLEYTDVDFKNYNIDSLLFITDRPPIVFKSGKGMWLEDHNGKKYLDWLQGWAVNCLGHSPECISEVLEKQSKKIINPSPAFFNEPSIDLSNLLTNNSCFDRVFFANSGAEANEGAIKLARKWGQMQGEGNVEYKYEIITFENSFHGRTLATMSASGKKGWDKMFIPKVPGFPKARFNDIKSVENLISKKTIAVMIEPIQGEGGIIPADIKFMKELRDLTIQKNLLLIVDEVQAGMGRTGKLFAYENFEIEPDIMTLGKGIGGGVPLAALLCKEKFACFDIGDQGGTYNGNPLMTAVGKVILKTMLTNDFLNLVSKKGKILSEGLKKISDKYDMKGERGIGLIRALKLNNENANKIVSISRDLNPTGLILNSPKPDLIRFLPALNVEINEIKLMLRLLDQAIIKSLNN